MKYLGPTVLLLALCGWAFVGGMEFQKHRQNTKAPVPAIVAPTPAPAGGDTERLKVRPMTAEERAAYAKALSARTLEMWKEEDTWNRPSRRFPQHPQNAMAAVPAILAPTPAPVPVKEIPITVERAEEIAVGYLQQSPEGDNYRWGANTRKTVFLEDTRRWRVSLEAYPKPLAERKSGRDERGRERILASVRQTELEIMSDGEIDKKKPELLRDW